MARYLTVGILQMPLTRDTDANLRYIEKGVETLMRRDPRPELIAGVEGGIGYGAREGIPGAVTERMGRLAARYGIYLLPGTMFEKNPECPEGEFYNAAPILGPDGRLIDVYRKMAPWRPAEYKTCPGKRYVVFEMPEKKIKVGVMVCFDLNFPEIARNLTLSGAEVLLKLTEDFEEAYRYNRPLHLARAIENQAFLVSTNAVGQADGRTMYGHSMVVNPSGHVLLEAHAEEALLSATIDADEAAAARKYGTCFGDHCLTLLKRFNFPMPYAGDVARAPVYRGLDRAADRPQELRALLAEGNIEKVDACEKGENGYE